MVLPPKQRSKTWCCQGNNKPIGHYGFGFLILSAVSSISSILYVITIFLIFQKLLSFKVMLHLRYDEQKTKKKKTEKKY